MSGKGKWIFGGFAAFVIVGAMLAQEEDPSTTPASPKPSASVSAIAETPAVKSMAEQFKEHVRETGSTAEQQAVSHVTKVQGADEQNDILDAAEVYTDYTGDMLSGDAPNGKLIASAFADWKDSKNGLVTVYNAGGEILSNGNF